METTVFEFGRIAQGAWTVWVLGAVFALILAGVVYLYRRDTAEQSSAVRYALLFFRLGAWALALWIFLDPRTRSETSVEHPSLAVLAADRSLSMSIEDSDSDAETSDRTSRAEQAIRALAASDLARTLNGVHEVAVYRFGRTTEQVLRLPRRPKRETNETVKPEPVDWKELLAPTDAETRVGDALSEILREESSHPLSGIVLFTDGRQTAGEPVEAALEVARSRRIPVFPVPVGSSRPAVNLRITHLQMPRRAFRGDEIQAQAVIQAFGIENKTVSVEFRLRSADSDQQAVVLETKSVTLPEQGKPVSVDLNYLPEELGNWRLSAHLTELPGELRAEDNVAAATLEVVDRKTNVLLFASGPMREYRLLRTLLFRDATVETTVLLQSAPDGISQDADHLLYQFPSAADQLFGFDVIVAFDPNWGELTPDQRRLLVEWVSTQAGGLILIAGAVQTPYQIRNASLEPIFNLYPVVLRELSRRELEGQNTQSWPLVLTDQAKGAAYLQLDDDPARSAEIWERFSGFYTTYPVTQVKPGAHVLMEYGDPRIKSRTGLAPPVLATQFYGAGRVAYIGSGEFWRLRRLKKSYYDRFWIQLVRQVGQGRLLRGSSRATLVVDADRVPVGTAVPVRARLLDAEFKPLLSQRVSLSIVDPQRNSADLVLETTRPGEFEGEFAPRTPGEYRLQLLSPESGDIVEEQLQATVPQLEFDNPRSDPQLLRRIADETGGRVVDLESLAELADLLKDKSETSVLSGTPRPLWDRAWVMLLMAVLLGLEWLIRKLFYLA